MLQLCGRRCISRVSFTASLIRSHVILVFTSQTTFATHIASSSSESTQPPRYIAKKHDHTQSLPIPPKPTHAYATLRSNGKFRYLVSTPSLPHPLDPPDIFWVSSTSDDTQAVHQVEIKEVPAINMTITECIIRNHDLQVFHRQK